MAVKKITLLSIEEYQQFQYIVPLVEGCWWWLRSPGLYRNFAAGVRGNGRTGYDVNAHRHAIRPALKLNLEMTDNRFWSKPEKLIGAKIEHGGYNWTILDASFGELYVLCDDIFDYRRFDPKSNDWGTSELKHWLETEGLNLITN